MCEHLVQTLLEKVSISVGFIPGGDMCDPILLVKPSVHSISDRGRERRDGTISGAFLGAVPGAPVLLGP